MINSKTFSKIELFGTLVITLCDTKLLQRIALFFVPVAHLRVWFSKIVASFRELSDRKFSFLTQSFVEAAKHNDIYYYITSELFQQMKTFVLIANFEILYQNREIYN